MKTTELPLTVEPTTDVISAIPASENRGSLRRQLRTHGSLVFSAALHMSILLVMAFCVLPVAISGHLKLNAAFNTGEGDLSVQFPLQDDAALLLPVDFDISAPTPEPNTEWPDPDIALPLPESPATIEPRPLAPPTVSPGMSAESSSAASSIEEAVDRVTGSIQRKLQEGDVLVVWLLDASHSMVDKRQRVALRLESFFRRLDGGADPHHQLLNAVVSFGVGMKERVVATAHRDPILSSISELPVDASGTENVFTAIGQCVSKYRRKCRDGQLMIVVWTDESGDDVAKLENTIGICQDHGVSVSVVGPSAVLGAEVGLHSFTDLQTQQVHHLPVKRGPDSALPERLELGYWFLTQEPQLDLGLRRGFRGAGLPSWYGYDDLTVPGYKCIAALEVALPSWYGGRDLKGLVSGFGPYALIRLTLQTGGAYIIFDREDDRVLFPADAMRAYLPDYRSAEEYLHDVQSRPLRRAVMEAVKLTQNKKLGPPPTLLFGKWSESPKGFMRTYLTPAGFVSNLRRNRLGLKAEATRTTQIVEQALAHVAEPGSVDKGLEYEYERENSRRWRAWYDLTRGRLLATSIRLEEYRLTCDEVVTRGFLDETTNHLILVPSLEMKSGSDFRRRAEEAERLLMRCVRENANTPWALLAQRELEYGLGIDVRQRTLVHVEMPASSTRYPLLPRL